MPIFPSPKVAPEFADATVLDEHAAVFRMRDLWREKPVVLVFVRHFG